MENYSLASLSGQQVPTRATLQLSSHSHSSAVKVSQENKTLDVILSIRRAITTVKQDIPTVNNSDHVNSLIDFVFTNCTFSPLHVLGLQLH